ncbi:MAG: O-antigen ligase family protein [Ferruginibacter sp.]|nr:O-antigen ligase family protein [Ferruginibacter sp.]
MLPASQVMKQLFFIQDNLTNKISYYHLVCFLVALPFDRFYSELIFISFVIHTLIHLRIEYVKRMQSKEVLVVAVIFLAGLLSTVYSTNKNQALTDASIQLALILFPITIACNGLDIKRYKEPLLKIFGFTCVASIAYLYVDALQTIQYFHLPVSALIETPFLNQNFSAPIELHATYLSMYVAFSICIFLLLCLKEKPGSGRAGYICCILLLTMGMLQLSSRAVGIALIVMVVLVFPFFLVNAKRKILYAATAIIWLLMLSFTVQHIGTFRERYFSELGKDLSSHTTNIEVTEPRMVRWKAAMSLVAASPVIGYGGGTEITLLKKKYFERKLYSSYLNQFNAHNEYLSLLIKTGMIGFLIYGFVLAYGCFIAWKKKDIAFASFMVLIAITSASENILDLNKGIFFYSFFFTLFLMANKKRHTDRGPMKTTGNQTNLSND